MTTRMSLGAAIAVAIGGLIALASAMGIGRFAYTPILPFMIENGGLSKAEGGWIAASNYLGYLIGALVAASPNIGRNRKLWLLFGLALGAASTGSMGLTDDIRLYGIFRFTGGFASAIALLFASAMVLDRLAASGRPGLNALLFAGVGTGIAFSAIFVGWLGEDGEDGTKLWFYCAGLSAAACILCAILIPSEPRKPKAEGPTTTALESARGMSRLLWAYFLFGFGYIITATFISTMARETPQLADFEIIIWLAVGLGAAPSVILWTWLGQKTSKMRGYAWACLTQGSAIALSVLGLGPTTVIISAALLGSTMMGITALGMDEARRLTRGDQRSAIAALTVAFSVGQMIGPAFGGILFDATGSLVTASLFAACALFLAGALTWHPIKRAEAPYPPLDEKA